MISGASMFVIVGSTGEYSDRTVRVVCIVLSETDAKAFVVRADRYAKMAAGMAQVASVGEGTYSEKYRAEFDRLRDASPFDKELAYDYCGPTEYTYAIAPIVYDVAKDVVEDVPVEAVG